MNCGIGVLNTFSGSNGSISNVFKDCKKHSML